MKHIRSTFFLLTTLFIMASCGEDRSGEYYALVGENLWIEQIMKEHYLWYDSIPAIKETDYFAEPENFQAAGSTALNLTIALSVPIFPCNTANPPCSWIGFDTG